MNIEVIFLKNRNLKTLLALTLCIAVMVSFFAACSDKKNKPEAENTDSTEYDMQWVLSPSVEAQIITPLTRADFNEATNHYDISYADCFRIMQSGKYGIIDIEGNIVIEPQFDELFAIRGSMNFLGVKIDEEGNRRQTYIHYGTFKTEPAYKKYNSEKYEYYWNTSTNEALFVETKNGDSKPQSFAPSLPETVKGVVYSGNSYSATGKYGLYFNSENVTGMRYTGAGCFSDGKAAFKSNDKWGYIDSNGRTVIPFEYDAVWGYSALGGEDTPYESFNGYVTLCKDKKFGVMKDDGKIIVPFVYDSATPVVNNKLFVKTDGKWGILLVDSMSAAAEDKTSASSTEQSTTETTTSTTVTKTTVTTTEATTTTTKAETTTTHSDEEENTTVTKPTTTNNDEPTYSIGTYTLTGSMNVRSEPSASSEIVAYANSGESIYIDKVSGTWGHTVYKGNDGWINLKYISS